MTQTKVKIKASMYGDFTRQRLDQAPEGITLPDAPNQPSYVNSPIRSECAPTNAKKGELEEKLDAHEIHVLAHFVACSLAANGRIKSVNPDGGGSAPKKSGGGKLPFNGDTQKMISWYQRIMKAVPDRTKCGLELFYRIWIGESGKISLEDVGRVWSRSDDYKIIYGAYVTFYRMAIQDVQDAEFKIRQHTRHDRRNSRYAHERL